MRVFEFVWNLNFKFWNLFEIWILGFGNYLSFGIWNLPIVRHTDEADAADGHGFGLNITLLVDQ